MGYSEVTYADKTFTAGSGPNPPEAPTLTQKKRGKVRDKYRVDFSYTKDLTEPYKKIPLSAFVEKCWADIKNFS